MVNIYSFVRVTHALTQQLEVLWDVRDHIKSSTSEFTTDMKSCLVCLHQTPAAVTKCCYSINPDEQSWNLRACTCRGLDQHDGLIGKWLVELVYFLLPFSKCLINTSKICLECSKMLFLNVGKHLFLCQDLHLLQIIRMLIKSLNNYTHAPYLGVKLLGSR